MSVSIPTIQVGTNNQTKVITPALLTAIDPDGFPVALKADSTGQIRSSGAILNISSGSPFTFILLSSGAISAYTPTGITVGWFQNNANLVGLAIGSTVVSIGDAAFRNCVNLVGHLVIPNSVTTVGIEAFKQCVGLTQVTIPNSVTAVYSAAFSNCTSLTNMNCHIAKTLLPTNCFSGSGVTTIHACNTDTSWTAGTGQTIGGKSGITVIKDL